MNNTTILIIVIILVCLWIYYQQNNQEEPALLSRENTSLIKDLKRQVQHYQKLYQDRIAKDLGLENKSIETQTDNIGTDNQLKSQKIQSLITENKELAKNLNNMNQKEERLKNLESDLENSQKLVKELQKKIEELELGWDGLLTVEEWLDAKYIGLEKKKLISILLDENQMPTIEMREKGAKNRWFFAFLESWDWKIRGEELDLSEYPNLRAVFINDYFLKTPLTKLTLKKTEELRTIKIFGQKLTSLDVSQCPKLMDLYCDDYLFLENKIIGLEKTSIVRLDCREGDLLPKSQDPKFIWDVFIRKYNFAFPEMKFIDISDLNELAGQVNEKTANNKDFLDKVALKHNATINRTECHYYWILDQIANTILARCLVIQNRLYEGKDEEYERELEKLAKEPFQCHAMNPKHPEASLYENREKLVNQALTPDLELLQRLADLPYISPWVKEQLAKNKPK